MPTDDPPFNSIEDQVLDDAENSLRMGNIDRLVKIIFVWSQRKDDLRAGTETWEDQRI